MCASRVRAARAAWALGLAAGLAVVAAGCTHRAAGSAVAAPPTGTAAPVPADPHIGAVFLGNGDDHSCAAAVLHTRTGDLIVTAAHCLTGGDAGFVPGFSGDGGPAGRWRVSDIYFDPRWLASQDPRADFAIARVHQDGGRSLEDAVGEGLALGSTPAAGSVVTVTAYPGGTGGPPIACRGVTATTSNGYPALRCGGFVDGTSGAPWVSGSSVVGVIGGLHGGGCDNDVSYSAPFGDAIHKLLSRAEAGGPADNAPQVYEGDC